MRARSVPAEELRRNAVTDLVCMVCGRTYAHGDVQTCPACGAQGILDVRYDYGRARLTLNPASLAARPKTMWRYREILPVDATAEPPPLHIGWTPIYPVPRLADAIGVSAVWLKDDGRNPTNSFKDRASAVGVMKTREFGYTHVACASTGNAASSLAGLAAAVGLSCAIFVPRNAPEPKLAQLRVFGATVFRVLGSYEDAFELCRQSCNAFGWYNRNSGTNPFLVEGKKSAGCEIAEQMQGLLPDWIVVSVGDGCTIGGIGKGLQEMHELGLIDRVPRLLGVQAEGARPVVDAFTSGEELRPASAHTIADSIAVGTPRNWRKAIRQIKSSAGAMVAVSDQAILEAMTMTARLGGVFGEPAAVAAVAGLRRAREQDIVMPKESALVVITGNGLKDIDAAKKAAGPAIDIQPRLDEVEKHISRD